LFVPLAWFYLLAFEYSNPPSRPSILAMKKCPYKLDVFSWGRRLTCIVLSKCIWNLPPSKLVLLLKLNLSYMVLRFWTYIPSFTVKVVILTIFFYNYANYTFFSWQKKNFSSESTELKIAELFLDGTIWNNVWQAHAPSIMAAFTKIFLNGENI